MRVQLARSAQSLDAPPPPAVGFAWLCRLRWWAFALQVLLLGVTPLLFEVPKPGGTLIALVCVFGASNAAFEVARRFGFGTSNLALGGALLLDAVLLTASLDVSGGPMNPLSVFYIVHVVLAAVMLDTRWAAALAGFTSLAFGSLFVSTPEASMHALHRGDMFILHLRGMWLAYAIAAGFLGLFVARLSRTIRDRERIIADLRARAARTDKLGSLATLAAGAAHELGTPLGTIMVVAGELRRRAETSATPDSSLLEDAKLLQDEGRRCKEILQTMAAGAGAPAGEAAVRVPLASLGAEVTRALGAGSERVDVTIRGADVVALPVTLARVLVNLVRNGLDASAAGARVRLTLDGGADGGLTAMVEDEGHGIAPEALAHVGEPFFTTKAPGKGLGLGVYLARALADLAGGDLEIDSTPNLGTSVRLHLPPWKTS